MIFAAFACLLLLSACGAEGNPDTSDPVNTPTVTEPTAQQSLSSEASYQVSVVDALGNPCNSGIIVRFMQGSTQVSMQVVGENGMAVKTLPRDHYTVELAFTGDEDAYYYSQEGLELTSDVTQLQVVLSRTVGTDVRPLYTGEMMHDAYPVEEGCTHVKLSAGRNYYLFTPRQAGMYEISVPEGAAAVGYYGAPHYVQEYSAAEVVDNKIRISVKADMIGTGDTGTTVLVIGLDSEADAEAILAVVRIGEPAWDVSDEPWTIYQTTAQLSPFKLDEGKKLKDFDVMASSDAYQLVYNETDGFYHLNTADGPLVLVRLTQPSKYLDELSTVAEKSHICKYFYDADGKFVKKESYNECLENYFACADELTGTYPLTEDLKYIIQQRGDYYGWWNTQSGSGCIFLDSNGMVLPGLNTDIAWLFICCYESN